MARLPHLSRSKILGFLSPDVEVLRCAPAGRGVHTVGLPHQPVEHVLVGLLLEHLSRPQQVTQLAVVWDTGVARHSDWDTERT